MNAEIVGQCEVYLDQLVSGQVIDRVAHDVVGVDRANLIDQHPCRPTGDLHLGAVDSRAG